MAWRVASYAARIDCHSLRDNAEGDATSPSLVAAAVADGAVTATAAVVVGMPAEETPDQTDKMIISDDRPNLAAAGVWVVRCESVMVDLQCRGT